MSRESRGSGDMPLSRAAVWILSDRVDAFRRRAKKAAARGDADRIHDLRVASRRLLEGLATFEPLFPPAPYRKQYRWVREIARRLGSVRNADVARDLCVTLLRETTDPACATALAHLAKRYERDRREAAEVLEEALCTKKIREHTGAMATFVRAARPPVDGPDATLASRAMPVLSARLATVEDLARPLPGPDEADSLHRLRIAIKKFRYTIEALEGCYDGGAGSILEELRALQDRLGRIHDFDVLLARTDLERERTAGKPRLGDRGLALDALRVDLTQRRLGLYESFRATSGATLGRDLGQMLPEALNG